MGKLLASFTVKTWNSQDTFHHGLMLCNLSQVGAGTTLLQKSLKIQFAVQQNL